MYPAYLPIPDYSHWDAGLWTRVLAASGVLNPFTGAPFSEAALAGLGGGIGFMIFTFEYKDTTTASVVTRFHPGPFTENLLRRSGANVNIQQTGSATLAQSRLDAALETGVPAVVRVVHGTLPWVPADPVADMDSVDVVVVARDGADYLMDDGGEQLELISAPALAAARTARKADKHWQAHVANGDGDTLTAEVVRQAMAETAQQLLSQEAPPGVPAGYAKNFGIAGLQTWTHRLRDTSTRRGWTRVFADPQRAQAGFSMLHGLLAGRRFSGPGALRPLYAQFLREVTAYEVTADGQGRAGVGLSGVDRHKLVDAAAQYEVLGAQWDQLAALIGSAGEPNLVLIADQVQDLSVQETTAALDLQTAVGETL